jgi:hypothetical protein
MNTQSPTANSAGQGRGEISNRVGDESPDAEPASSERAGNNVLATPEEDDDVADDDDFDDDDEDGDDEDETDEEDDEVETSPA